MFQTELQNWTRERIMIYKTVSKRANIMFQFLLEDRINHQTSIYLKLVTIKIYVL